MNLERVLALPIRALEKSTKRIRFELADGMQFVIAGGKDRRPRPEGVACFTPYEMVLLLKDPIDEESFKKVCLVKQAGLGTVVGVLPAEDGESGTPTRFADTLGTAPMGR